MTMFDERHFSTDSPSVRFHSDADGVTVDDSGVEFDWDEVATTTLDDVPHAEAFDTKEFYTLPATVARPIPQPYHFNDSVVWLQKPRDELKKAAWSLDNKPWTIGHPDTGHVKDVQDIKGFWKNPRYIESVDDLDADLYVPVGDDEATAAIEQTSDVSVGFFNGLSRTDEYDGVVGDSDADVDLDGYQTDLYFNHVASVSRGRCSSEHGCGLDSAPHGTTVITGGSEELVISDQSQYINPDDDRWYAVPPEDNPDDEWKFPITSCDGEDSVDSAWHFAIRHRGDISISWETLKDRIRRRASDLDCEMDLTEDNMSMEDCDCNHDGIDLSFDDLSPEIALDKVAAENDSIEAYLDDLRSKAEAATEAAETLDTDVEDVPDAASVLDERVSELESTVDELETPKRKEHVEFIVDRTDTFGDAEDLMELDLDELEDKRELVEELTDDSDETSETTANAGNSGDEDITVDDGYVASPWE